MTIGIGLGVRRRGCPDVTERRKSIEEVPGCDPYGTPQRLNTQKTYIKTLTGTFGNRDGSRPSPRRPWPARATGEFAPPVPCGFGTNTTCFHRAENPVTIFGEAVEWCLAAPNALNTTQCNWGCWHRETATRLSIRSLRHTLINPLRAMPQNCTHFPHIACKQILKPVSTSSTAVAARDSQCLVIVLV